MHRRRNAARLTVTKAPPLARPHPSAYNPRTRQIAQDDVQRGAHGEALGERDPDPREENRRGKPRWHPSRRVGPTYLDGKPRNAEKNDPWLRVGPRHALSERNNKAKPRSVPARYFGGRRRDRYPACIAARQDQGRR